MGTAGVLTLQRRDGVGVGVEITLRVRFGARTFAQHVVGAQRELWIGSAARERRVDGLADDEGVAEELHRLSQRCAHDRGNHRPREARGGEFAGQLTQDVRQQPAGGPEQGKTGAQQQVRIPRHTGVADGGEALGDQLIGALGIGGAQQCLGEAHERFALRAVERKLLEHPLHQGSRALIVARRFHPARGARAGALECVLYRREVSERFTGGGRFRPQCRGTQLRAQRSQRARLIRTVDQPPHGHVTHPPSGSELRLFYPYI